jgi:hypothetical protein
MFITIIGGIFFFSNNKQKKNEDSIDEASYKDDLLCRFVLDGLGKKIGESVAKDEDVLIIKSRNKYLGVPLKHIEPDDKVLVVKGLIDKEKAEIMGEKWRSKSFKEINYDD